SCLKAASRRLRGGGIAKCLLPAELADGLALTSSASHGSPWDSPQRIGFPAPRGGIPGTRRAGSYQNLRTMRAAPPAAATAPAPGRVSSGPGLAVRARVPRVGDAGRAALLDDLLDPLDG